MRTRIGRASKELDKGRVFFLKFTSLHAGRRGPPYSRKANYINQMTWLSFQPPGNRRARNKWGLLQNERNPLKKCQNQRLCSLTHNFFFFNRNRKIWTKNNKNSWVFIFQQIWKCALNLFTSLLVSTWLCITKYEKSKMFRYRNTSSK